MFPWWQELGGIVAFNRVMQLISMAFAVITTTSLLFLWRYGKQMINTVIEREQKASKNIKAVEKAAEQIRKELLSTQQNQDIADQRRQLAEMDVDTMRKELERTRQEYTKSESTLKDRIGELKDLNITQGLSESGTTEIQKSILDNQQKKMLTKLLATGPKGELDIISVLDNTKSHNLAVELKKFFDHYGWATRDIVQSAFSNAPEGLALIIHSKHTAPSYAKFLQRALTTLGLAVSAQIDNKYPEWSISLIVGQLDSE